MSKSIRRVVLASVFALVFSSTTTLLHAESGSNPRPIPPMKPDSIVEMVLLTLLGL